MNLNEQLGYAAGDRLLIINADDFGMCHSVNVAVQRLLSEGAVSSSTIMMPCPWSKEAVEWSARHPDCDVGVHLTFTSEWEHYKWGPVNRHGPVDSLITDEGWFPADCLTFEQQAREDQVRAEIIRQIERAKALGLEPSHLDNHMGSLYGLARGRDFLQTVLELCAQYGLPFRLPRRLPERQQIPAEMAGKAGQVGAFADALGVVIIDDLVSLPFGVQEGETYESFKRDMIALLRGLKPGVNELYIHPALVTEELKAINPHWAKRGWEYDIFLDRDVRTEIREEGIRLIHWKQLKQLQERKGQA